MHAYLYRQFTGIEKKRTAAILESMCDEKNTAAVVGNALWKHFSAER